MEPVVQFDAKWASRLGAVYPEAARQMKRLSAHIAAKQEPLFKLIHFCAANPELDAMRMYAEYNAALDAVALLPPRDEELELSDEELTSAQHAGHVKRLRTRANMLDAVISLLHSQRPVTINNICRLAQVTEQTIYRHFRAREELVAIAYRRMIDRS